jgi:acetolactate synthase-1/2/3 large subunit
MSIVADRIVNLLYENGVRCVFAVPGGSNLYILDAIRRDGRIELIFNHHEQASATAAFSYSAFNKNGYIGCCITTTGPAATNAITSVYSAWVDSIPLLVISGQVNYNDSIEYKKTFKKDKFCTNINLRQGGVQEVNISNIVSQLTKKSFLIKSRTDIDRTFREAFFLIKNCRPGPVWIDIPSNIQNSKYEESEQNKFDPLYYSHVDTVVNDSDIVRLGSMLSESKRPVIIIGGGIKLSKNQELIKKFIEKIKIPILVTWKAIDLVDNNHPYNFGRFGVYGQRNANFCIQNSDLIISIGSRLSIPQIGYNPKWFARYAKKIIVDIDKNELRKFDFDIDLPFNCSVDDFILQTSDIILSKTCDEWVSVNDIWKYKYSINTNTEDSNFVNSYIFIEKLSNHLTSDEVIVPGASGTAFTCFHQAHKVKIGQNIYTSNGSAEMGYDLPGSIGAYFATKAKRIIGITGDGSLQMNLSSLQTIVHHNIPLKLFYLQNDEYLTMKHTLSNICDSRYVGCVISNDISFPDIEKISRAYGIKFVSCNSDTEIDIKISETLQSDGPVICRIRMRNDQILAPKISYRKLKNGNLSPCPLEDMYPFLDREELKMQMIVPLLEESLSE